MSGKEPGTRNIEICCKKGIHFLFCQLSPVLIPQHGVFSWMFSLFAMDYFFRKLILKQSITKFGEGGVPPKFLLSPRVAVLAGCTYY